MDRQRGQRGEEDVAYLNKHKGNLTSSGNSTSSGNHTSRDYVNNFKEAEAYISKPPFRSIVNSEAKPKPPSSGGYKKTRRNRRRSAKSRSRKH